MSSPAPSALIRFAPFQVGAIRVTTLADGIRRFPLPDGFVTNAPRAEVEAALATAGVPAGEMLIHFNPVLVDMAGHRALIDTGNGAEAAQAPGATAGLLAQSLRAAGIDPATIDTVIISHFHGDHIGGLVQPDGSPAFANARVLVPAAEWAFWMDAARPSPAAAAEKARSMMTAIGGQVAQYEWDEEVLPGITARGTPGHTPGHTSFDIVSDGARLIVQSDVTNNPAVFLTHPGWHAMFDMDPHQAEAWRRRVLDRAAEQGIPVQGFHFPFPGRGRVEKTADGYALIPLE